MKVTGLPLGTAAVAVTVLVPAVVPRVQEVSVATPLALVTTGDARDRDDARPPPVTAKVTGTPATGLPPTSVTTPDGGAATGRPTVSLCAVAELAVIVLAAPAVALAVKSTGLPVSPAAVAVTVLLFVPAVVPSVQDAIVATPLALVATTRGAPSVPPPPVTAKVTFTPATGLRWRRAPPPTAAPPRRCRRWRSGR